MMNSGLKGGLDDGFCIPDRRQGLSRVVQYDRPVDVEMVTRLETRCWV